MTSRRLGSFVMLAVLSAAPAFSAISYSTTDLSGSQWQNDYVVTADATSGSISEFTVYFDVGKYSDLSLLASPTSWDSVLIQPDAGLPADGFLDSAVTASSLAQGQSQGGFSVRFTYTGTGAPGSQSYDIVDPNTFAALYSGVTTVADGTGGVPTGPGDGTTGGGSSGGGSSSGGSSGGASGGGTMTAPELDANGAVSALLLLSASIAVVRGRKHQTLK